MKKVIVISLAIILILGAGILIPVLMSKDGGTISPFSQQNQGQTAVPNNTPKVNNESNDATSVTGQNVNTDPQNNSTNTPVQSTISENTGKIDTEFSTPSSDVKGISTNSTPKSDIDLNPKPTPTPQKTTSNNSGSEGSGDWVERKIQEHRDEILSGDLADFRRIYSRVDVGYIQGLLNDGYTDENLDKVKKYLRGTLGGDYERAKELFFSYSYILEEM